MPVTTLTEQQSIHHAHHAKRYILGGQVQGVGFRPFVYRLAQAHNITGWIENRVGHVLIHAEGLTENLQYFQQALLEKAPYPARPLLVDTQTADRDHYLQFQIRDSSTTTASSIHIPTDLPVCDSCLKELNDPQDRRFHYPFINCSQCGPRYTLIRTLPYDRANTTMAAFSLCHECRQEYEDPTDRRFHAEPVACPNCGPQLIYQQADSEIRDTTQALDACMKDLHLGKVIAVKGVGGYHLLCDAGNDQAIQRLRDRKHRPHKPFAVMVDETQLDEYVELSSTEHQLLCSTIRPVVVIKKVLIKKAVINKELTNNELTNNELTNKKILPDNQSTHTLSDNIAPGLQEIGILLPYSPLHHLLIQLFGGPLIATSANISGEPVLTHQGEVVQRLDRVADAYLHHDRHIQRPADDPVYRVIHHKPRPLRLGRGNAPLELPLPFPIDEPVLAVGGHMKNTIALAWHDRIVISPHIGELDSPRSQQVFEQCIHDLQELYQVNAQRVLCDAHPGYRSHRWAQHSGLPVHSIYHHHAHAACFCGEYPNEEHWLVFCWDGVGLGTDQTLWGGEALLGNCGNWQRIASFKPFHVPGGDKAGREPWRSAAALCWESGFDLPINLPESALAYQAWRNKLNCPATSSVGRLFDAAAALTGIVTHTSYEAQGPMMLESLAHQGLHEAIELPLVKDNEGIWRTDWSPLLALLTDTSISISDRARCFHETLACGLLQQALVIRESEAHHDNKEFVVGLSGGVFQNRLLTERVMDLLQQNNFSCYLPEYVPVNDAGLCYGQVMEYLLSTGTG